MKKNNLTLIGFMGTGKTSIARKLSQKIKWKVIDLDAEIEKREKKKIVAIFADHGEPYFRRLERAMLKEALQKENCVISTGGGIVLNPLNRKDLKKKSLVVCLTTNLQEIKARTTQNRKRPLLNTKNTFQTLQNLLKSRRPLYKETGEFFVSTTGKTACESAKTIIKRLGLKK